jgi:LPXTG-motif cell wall-anchored protein
VTPTTSGVTSQPAASASSDNTLPATGDDTNEAAAVLGTLALGLTGLMGLAYRKRREDD